MENESLRQAALGFTKWVGSIPSLMVHTGFFLASFAAVVLGFLAFEQMLLILTTIVSLEAIYLAIFIQMTINMQAESLKEVSEDVVEIQEDIDEIQEDVEEIQEDVDELQEDVEDISEDVEDMSEEDEKKAQSHQIRTETLAAIHSDLKRLMADVEKLKED